MADVPRDDAAIRRAVIWLLEEAIHEGGPLCNRCGHAQDDHRKDDPMSDPQTTEEAPLADDARLTDDDLAEIGTHYDPTLGSFFRSCRDVPRLITEVRRGRERIEFLEAALEAIPKIAEYGAGGPGEVLGRVAAAARRALGGGDK